MMQSTVSHQMQPGVQASLSQLSDRSMQFHILSKNRVYRRRLGGKYNGLEKLPKPQMEKKRRERLNASLEMLRHLVAEPILKQGAEKLEKADILELTVQYLQSSANHEPWIQSTNTAWSYFLAGYTSCEENLRQFVDSTASTYSGVKMASLITTIESQKLQAVYNFLNAFNQQIGSPLQPPASRTDTNYPLTSEDCTRRNNVIWRPW